MSDRNTIAPGSAMADTLSRQRRKLSTLERRTSWTSAIQTQFTVENRAGHTTIVNPSGVGWERAAATLIATLELDPGRWTLVGELVQQVEATPLANARYLGAIMDWRSNTILGSEMVIAGEGGPSNVAVTAELARNSQVAASVSSDDPITVELYAFVGVAPVTSTEGCYLWTSSILAFPS